MALGTTQKSGAGWEALSRGDWPAARDWFEREVARSEYGAALEGLSWTAFSQNDADRLFWARERAYRRYREEGDPISAARMAVWISSDYTDFRGETAVANGWRQRARRLLEGEPLCPEHGWLALFDGEAALMVEEDAERALACARRAWEIGRQVQAPDVEAMGLAMEGLALVTSGEIDAGMSRLDEAAAAVVGDELKEQIALTTCLCYLVQACERAKDYDRATQWCQRMREYVDGRQIALGQGVCRAHYAGVLIWRGKWEEAEAELAVAEAFIRASRPPMAAEAVVRLADLRRRQGRLEEARRLFSEVEWHPMALLGLAEMALAEGQVDDAQEALERALRHVPENSRTQRASALALLARVQAMLGDHEAARQKLEEVRGLSEAIATLPVKASFHFSAGVLQAAEGDHASAARSFEDAVDLFERGGGPYEAAVTRLELARCLAASGRLERARGEARAAEQALASLGAVVDAARASALLASLGVSSGASPPALTARQVDILRLIAEGRSDREIAAALVVSEHTVHRHVANILQRLGLPSRAAAVAFAGRSGIL
ncbi:MAG TPA: tetratricopeptide repeat protein [Dehalococcoidia bacterium]|nr:tetratricopeptide repeat protein [Dehalococcoidia bacterium]